MIRTLLTAICLATFVVAIPVEAKQHRSTAAKNAFQREYSCPVTGKTKGPCPGYIVDHVIPLCAGGADAPGNMQWQTVADAKAKDRAEREQCRIRK